ncbi:hypothetical protein OG223_47425 [Streptomyces sp. NBC_01478]|uniref:hypothetical protein n=1 Tax=Streptomyces sp. NBC_01478 TaxID=2903882 RepID=UPI002E364C71|nr:hypothetical protein [Streptomyces sp. NBC_01478]
MEHHQVAIYLAAMAVGALLGWVAPAAGPGLEHAINPVLGALLFVTFLQVPAAELVRSLRDGRFLSAALVVNFVVVPLMTATLLVVVASQVPKLGDRFADVASVIPFYVVFLLVMALAGRAVARVFRLEPPAGRAIVFTGATRNSLVVLPLALALPDDLAVAAVVVVTQTLVEVVGMVTYVRLVPRLIPERTGQPDGLPALSRR